MLEFKIDVIAALKNKGYSTYVLRKEKLIGVQTFENMKKGIVPGIATIDTLCKLLDLQPGSIIRYVPDAKTENK